MIVQDPAGRLVMVIGRCCAGPSTFAVTSTDGGVTWSAASAIYEGDFSVNPTGGRVPLVAATTTGLLVIRGNPSPAAVIKVPPELTLVPRDQEIILTPDPYDDSVVLDETGAPVYGFGDLRRTFVRRGETGPDLLVTDADVGGTTIKIAGGARGVIAVADAGQSPGPTSLVVRKLTGNALGAPVTLTASDDTGPGVPFATTDQTGRFHVVWRGPQNQLLYRRSDDGVTWTPTTILVGASDSLFDPVASAGPDGKGWVVFTTTTGNGPMFAVPLAVGSAAGNPGVPDKTGIDNPRVLRNGPSTVVAPGRFSVGKLRRTKCLNVRLQSTKPARVRIAVFSGRKSIRLFGTRTVTFATPGKKLVCVRVPLRAVTANIRQPFGFITAYKDGVKAKPGEAPGKEKRQSLVFFP
jgi:hypothetical protein